MQIEESLTLCKSSICKINIVPPLGREAYIIYINKVFF